jgi:nitroreductase
MSKNNRFTENAIDPMFTDRWSPRAFDPTFQITQGQMMRLFEAAKWSPSCFNEQPWKFLYCLREEKNFELFTNLLVDANKVWAQNASALVFIIAEKKFSKNDKPNKHALFDCGAAWMAMSLQARRDQLYTHAMAGIKFEEIAKTFDLPAERFEVVCGVAIGAMAKVTSLLPENLREMESPNGRKDLDTFVFNQTFHEKVEA